MAERKFRVLAVASHPVQYMSPIFRRMAEHPRLDLHVAYCSLRGAEAGYDPEFGTQVKWDVPLLDGYEWTHVPNKGSGDETFWGLNNPGLKKIIRDGKFDAVLCLTGYLRASFWIARLAALFSRSAFLFGADAVTTTPLDGRVWKKPVKRLVWPLLFRLATQVVAPSSGTRELMLSLGIPAKRITLTPYCVDNDWWIAECAKVDRPAIRASWHATPSDVVILFCAKLQIWKRPLDLLRAFARANRSEALLVFAGEGPLRKDLESEAVSLGVSERVRFLGFVNQTQLPSIYASSDLLVLPSSYDAFGVVVNEAMLCGCSVAVSDRVGAARDLVAPVAPGFIFPCGDVEALATILGQAADDRNKLAAIAYAARKRMDTWSPRENVAAVVDAIEQAVARIGRSPAPAPLGNVSSTATERVRERPSE